jgi:hypothetical protein
MSQQRRKKYTSFLEFLLIVIVVVIGIGCDSILPEDFKKKDYTIAEIDGRACTILLSDTTGKGIASLALASLDTTIVDSATLANSTENQIILAKFSLLIDTLPQLVQESLIVVDSTGQKNSYAVLTIPQGQAKDLYIYTSLFYTAENVNEYVTIRLLKSDTSEVAFSNDMAGEVVSGGTQTIMVESQERIVPIIRSRDKVHVEAGVYLVRLTMSNPQTIGTYKITILSF